MSATYEIMSRSDVPVSEWESLLPNYGITLYSGPHWHRAIVGVATPAIETCVISKDTTGQIDAILPLTHFTAPFPNVNLNPALMFGDCGMNDPGVEDWLPYTHIGGSQGGNTAIIVAQSAECWATAAEAALRDHAGVVVAPQMPYQDVAALSAYFPDAPILLAGLRSEMTVRGPNWEEHLAAFPRNRRKHIKADISRLSAGNRTMEHRPLLAEDIHEIAELINNTQTRNNSPRQGAEAVAYIEKILHTIRSSPLGENLVLFSCYAEGERIGASVAIRDGNVLNVKYAGMDYTHVGNYAEYANLVIHEPMRYGANHAMRTVNLGIGASHAKLVRGANVHLQCSLLLRPPAHWTEEHTIRYNAKTADTWLAESGSLLGEELRSQLETTRALALTSVGV